MHDGYILVSVEYLYCKLVLVGRHNMFLIGLRFSGGRSMSGKATVETVVRTAVHDAISPAFICAFDTDVRTSTTAIIETAFGPANCLTSIQVTVGHSMLMEILCQHCTTPKSNVNTGTEQKHSRNIYEQNELQKRDTYQTIFDEKEEAAPVFMQQEIASPRVALENTILFPPAVDFRLDATFTQNSSSEDILEQIVFDSNEQNELQRRDTYQTNF